jgi:hypothetical protein
MDTRKFWMGAVALAVAAVCAAPVAAAPVLGTKGAGRAEAEKWMVDDAEVVMILNLKEMLGSAVMKKGGIKLFKEMLDGTRITGPRLWNPRRWSSKEAQEALDAIGLDPLKDLDGVLFTFNRGELRVVVRGRFDTARIHTALEKHAKAKPDQLKLAKDGATQLYQFKDKEWLDWVVAFVDRATLVVTPTREATVDAVKNGGKNRARLTREMKAALDRFTGKESVATAIVVTDEMKKAIGKVPQVAAIAPKFQTVTAAVTLTDGAELNLVGNMTDSKAADQLQKTLNLLKAPVELLIQNNKEIQPLAGMVLAAVKISKDKESAKVDLKITREMIDKANKKP